MPHTVRFLICFIFAIHFLPHEAKAQSVKELYENAVDAYSSGQFAVAIDLYKQLLQVAPGFAPAYNGLGLAVQNIAVQDSDEAVNYFKKAIQYDPNFFQAYENLGRYYYKQQNFDQAKGYFEKALKIDANSVNCRISLGWIYLLAKGNPAKAVFYFKSAIDQDKTPSTYFGLGLAYFSNNQRGQALDMITVLRGMSQEELASRLEKVVRENRRVSMDPNPSPQTSTSDEAIVPAAASQGLPDAANIKVRLRGTLPD
jgi:tetratricopeptide (TPR) repeat protein